MSSFPQIATSPALDALAVHMYAAQRYGSDELARLLTHYRELKAADSAAYVALRDTPPGESQARGVFEARTRTAAALESFCTDHPLVVRYAACEATLALTKPVGNQ